MGMLFRLLILAGAVWLMVRWLRGVGSAHDEHTTESPMMRQCSWCGIHIPDGECTRSQDRYFCCEAHRDAFQSRRP